MKMRMWGVNTNILCRQHLLGEHKEVHMLVGCLNKDKNIKGFIDLGHVQINLIKKRHNQLVKEMKKRGYNHQSPLPEFKSKNIGKIDLKYNLNDLSNRCKECRKNIKNDIKI